MVSETNTARRVLIAELLETYPDACLVVLRGDVADQEQAFADLLSNIEYDKLDLTAEMHTADDDKEGV